MTPQSLLKFFGTQTAIGHALGCSQPTVCEWFETGKVPLGRQYQAELATSGKLKADLPALRKATKKK